jgi:hypothetical protein
MSVSQREGHRVFSRVPFSAAGRLHVAGKSLPVTLLDIALKGALVQCAAAAELALAMPCQLILPLTDDGESIQMNGRLAHLDAGHVGVTCDDIDLMSLTRLRRLLELNLGDADLMDRELTQLFARRP